jgi:polar amino acid transport system substrate-binding protein
MSRLITAFAAAMLALAGSAAAKEWKEVRIATEGAYPPFNSIDASGELQGFDVDIAKALCERMKVSCTYVAQDWDGIIQALLAGKYDAAVASMTITDEREKMVDFTDHYYSTPLAVVGLKEVTEDLSPEAVADMTIGAQSATTQATYAEKHYEPAGATIKLYPTQDDVNLDLVAGRLDALIGDKFVLLDWLKKDGAECCKMLGDAPNSDSRAGIAVREEDDDLREMINTALAEIRADGTYDKIRAKYFDFDIY